MVEVEDRRLRGEKLCVFAFCMLSLTTTATSFITVCLYCGAGRYGV